VAAASAGPPAARAKTIRYRPHARGAPCAPSLRLGLALHLLQSALVHLNTLLVQRVLAAPAWRSRLSYEDRRALSPLFWTHVNPYGRFTLDMSTHLDLELAPAS